MKSSRYWDRRAEETLLWAERQAAPTLQAIRRAYRDAAASLEGEMRRTFRAYRRGFTQEEALAFLREPLPQKELRRLRALLPTIQDTQFREQLLMQLNAPAARYRLTRLEYLKTAAGAYLAQGADRELALSTQCYREVLQGGRQAALEGLGLSLEQLPNKAVDRLLRARWAGRNYSASIWRNRGLVAKETGEILQAGVLSGHSTREMAKELAKRVEARSLAHATRLIRTEVNYFCNQGALEGYREAGVERYRFLATLDGRTSETCQGLDGKVFPVAEARAGENCPPMHPHCRSTVAPVVEGVSGLGLRAARDGETGKMEVTIDLPYGEWKRGMALFPQASRYRQGNGAFDLEAAKADYRTFLQTVPEKNRMYLEQAMEAVEYRENTLQGGPFGYSSSTDTLYFDSTQADFWEMDFNVVNTHELAHRIDAMFVGSPGREEFSVAIREAEKVLMAHPEKFLDYCHRDQEGFLSDICSGISQGKLEFDYQHNAQYWAVPGNREREVFANLFSLESFDRVEDLNFLKENLPILLEVYQRMGL